MIDHREQIYHWPNILIVIKCLNLDSFEKIYNKKWRNQENSY